MMKLFKYLVMGIAGLIAISIGVYIGVLICQRAIARFGNATGSRSIPEFLGERFDSEGMRLSAAVFSLILMFYLASQLVSGLGG